MVEICKKIFPVFCHINPRPEQPSLFQLKGTHQLIFYLFKLLICGLDHLWYKGFLTRLLHHLSAIT